MIDFVIFSLLKIMNDKFVIFCLSVVKQDCSSVIPGKAACFYE